MRLSAIRIAVAAFLLLVCVVVFSRPAWGQARSETLEVAGVSAPVEIFKDPWGISHIYAESQRDLFFGQGFNVARDRLFQLEIWRRRATGTLAEILGPKALKHDIGARLLRARVDMEREMRHYHPDGAEIITAFCDGINAYIDLTRADPGLLPMEFRLLGIVPGEWTPEVVVSRHNGLFRNAGDEVELAGAVHVLGAEKVKGLMSLHPGDPDLSPAQGLDLSIISGEVLESYDASRAGLNVGPEDIIDRSLRGDARRPGGNDGPTVSLFDFYPAENLGSNNWVVGAERTSSGRPIMANDPHRVLRVPSLRYWVHLVGPGWDVIGGGEPALPGVSIGHNRHGAWGLTIFAVDQEDIYVYDTDPSDPDRYRYGNGWEEMRTIAEAIAVKGGPTETVELKYTRHGPVLHQDREHHKAYALRAAWLEIGGAPYLASLRMDQASDWEEFREACGYARTPSENMVWADLHGNIGWQAVGITPIRKGWSGLIPVPGDGRFEWDGFLPAQFLPHRHNPPEGFITTSNEDNLPDGYPYQLGYIWSDPYRHSRCLEFLSSGSRLTMSDMMSLQQDYLSIPARTLTPLLAGIGSKNERVQNAMEMLLDWDYVLDNHSIEAAIYTAWESRLSRNVWELMLPQEERGVFARRSLEKMVDWLIAPDARFGVNPIAGRADLLLKSMEEAIGDLTGLLGPDAGDWRYGQAKYKHVEIAHPLSEAVKPELRAKLDIGPRPRGGNGYTVNNTSGSLNQSSGASFRIIADVGDWDRSLGTNAPGQSGDPDNRHYGDLFKMWVEGKYFPALYSRDKIVSAAESVTVLK